MAWILALAFLGIAGPACAASCEPTLFPQGLDDLGFARVTAARLPVLRDPEACARPTGLCPSKAYLVAGDGVVTAQTADGKTCVAFIGPNRATIGWVDARALAAAPASAPSGDWTGTWRRSLGDAEAKIERRGGRLQASLFASAPGSRSGGVRTGGADGELSVRGDRGQLGRQDDPACKVAMRRLGRFLIVNDEASDDANSPCGGMGVTLNGIYLHNAR